MRNDDIGDGRLQNRRYILRSLAEAGLFLATALATLGWLLPGISDQTFGPDYLSFPIRHQLFGMFSWAHGTWPAYVPGFAGGQSAAALTLGQLYSPLTHLSALLPGYWDGHARDIHSFFALVSLGFTQWAVFRLLRLLRVSWTFAFLLSFASVFNLRMLNLFNYGASLQNYIGYILLCVSIVRFPLARRQFGAGVLVALSTYILLTGGHPQMAFLGMLGAGFVLLLTPLYLAMPNLSGTAPLRSWFAGMSATCGWIAVGGLLSAAYLVPFYFDFLIANKSRASGSFIFALGPFPTFPHTLLASFFAPFRADVNTGFAGPSILVLVLFTPLLLLLDRRSLRPAIVALWLFLLTVAGLTLATQLPLYRWFWEYVPLAQSFRIPGRATMLMPFPMLLLLAWLFRLPPIAIGPNDRRQSIPPWLLVTAAALAVYLVYPLFPLGAAEGAELAPALSINHSATQWESTARALGSIALVSLCFLALPLKPRLRALVSAGVVLAMVAQTGVLLRFGTIIKDKKPSMSFAEVDAHVKSQRGYTGRPGAGMRTGVMSNHWRRVHDWTGFKPFHARLFFRAGSVGSIDEAYAFMEEREDRRRAVVLDLEPEREAALQSTSGTGHVELDHLNNNRFRFEVETSVPAILAISEPYSPRFSARIDGKTATIYRADGYQLAVLVPAGHHSVEFRYDIRATAWGLGISFATACLMIGLAGRQFAMPALRWGLPLGAILLAAFLCSGLGNALDGPDLGWKYTWQWPPDWSAFRPAGSRRF